MILDFSTFKYEKLYNYFIKKNYIIIILKFII